METVESRELDVKEVHRTGHEKLFWSLGAWFGSSLGSCLWMVIVAGVLFAYGEPRVASIPLFGFVVTMGLACGLWSQRTGMTPLSGLMCLLLWLTICYPTVYYCLNAWASPRALASMGWSRSFWIQLTMVGIAPAAMLRFWLAHKD
ncbi:MAG: hypothetical protein AB8B50_00210 [Pirellulaceae bacterium]